MPKRKMPPYTPIAQLVTEFEEPSQTPPPAPPLETKEARRERIAKLKAEKAAEVVAAAAESYDPNTDEKIKGDPYKTLFVARLSYETTEAKLKKEFEQFGPIKRARLVFDTETGKPRGYAFVEYEQERDMKTAYKCAFYLPLVWRRPQFMCTRRSLTLPSLPPPSGKATGRRSTAGACWSTWSGAALCATGDRAGLPVGWAPLAGGTRDPKQPPRPRATRRALLAAASAAAAAAAALPPRPQWAVAAAAAVVRPTVAAAAAEARRVASCSGRRSGADQRTVARGTAAGTSATADARTAPAIAMTATAGATALAKPATDEGGVASGAGMTGTVGARGATATGEEARRFRSASSGRSRGRLVSPPSGPVRARRCALSQGAHSIQQLRVAGEHAGLVRVCVCVASALAGTESCYEVSGRAQRS